MSLGPLPRALRAFTDEVALALEFEVAQGAEVPFEIVNHRGLHAYTPLPGEFIRERMGTLARLGSYTAACEAIQRVDGTAEYLRSRGESSVPEAAAEHAEATLRAFLASVFAGASEFHLSDERFGWALAQLERLVSRSRSDVVVAFVIHGLELESDALELGDGLALAKPEALTEAPTQDARLLALYAVETAAGDAVPVATARERVAELLTALRLYDQGDFALGGAGWVRSDCGPWQLLHVAGGSGLGTSTVVVPAQQEDELRAFYNLIASRVPSDGDVAWALRRFEMGCERAEALETLTDHLLALRALLEPEGPGSGCLAARMAAVCALTDERAAMAERIAHAISLERSAIAGVADPLQDGVVELVREISGHLRAILRDVLCGHLSGDVRSVADQLIPADAITNENPRVQVDGDTADYASFDPALDEITGAVA